MNAAGQVDPAFLQLQQQQQMMEAGALAAQQVQGAADPALASQQQLQQLVAQMNANANANAQGTQQQGAQQQVGGPGGEMHVPHSGVTQPHALDPFTTQPNLKESGAGATAAHDAANAALMSVVAAGTDLADVKAASIAMEVKEAHPHGVGAAAAGAAGAGVGAVATPQQQLAAQMQSAADGYERARALGLPALDRHPLRCSFPFLPGKSSHIAPRFSPHLTGGPPPGRWRRPRRRQRRGGILRPPLCEAVAVAGHVGGRHPAASPREILLPRGDGGVRPAAEAGGGAAAAAGGARVAVWGQRRQGVARVRFVRVLLAVSPLACSSFVIWSVPHLFSGDGPGRECCLN